MLGYLAGDEAIDHLAQLAPSPPPPPSPRAPIVYPDEPLKRRSRAPPSGQLDGRLLYSLDAPDGPPCPEEGPPGSEEEDENEDDDKDERIAFGGLGWDGSDEDDEDVPPDVEERLDDSLPGRHPADDEMDVDIDADRIRAAWEQDPSGLVEAELSRPHPPHRAPVELPRRMLLEVVYPITNYASFYYMYWFCGAKVQSKSDVKTDLQFLKRGPHIGPLTVADLCFDSRDTADAFLRCNHNYHEYVTEKITSEVYVVRRRTSSTQSGRQPRLYKEIISLFPHHDVLELIVSILKNPALQNCLEWEPAERVHPLFGPIYGSAAMAHEIRQYQSTLPAGHYAVGFIISSDKSLVSLRKSAWPMYITLALIPPHVAHLHELGTARLVGYMPSLDLATYKLADGHGARELWHAGTRQLWTDEFIDAMVNGLRVEFLRAAGVIIERTIRPMLFLSVGDLEEMALVTLTRGHKGAMPCPSCDVKLEDLDKNPVESTSVSRTYQLEIIQEMSRRYYDLARRAKAAHVSPAEMKAIHAERDQVLDFLQRFGLWPEANAFWIVVRRGSSIFARTAVDPLRQIDLGITKGFIILVIKNSLFADHAPDIARGLIAELGRRLRAMPRPRTMDRVLNGPLIFRLNKEKAKDKDKGPSSSLTAVEFRNLVRLIVVAGIGILAADVLEMLAHYSQFCTLIRAPAPSEWLLQRATQALYDFHYAALRVAARTGTKPPGTLKYHRLGEYAPSIRANGPTSVMTTEGTERMHKFYAKTLSKLSNFSSTAAVQMIARAASCATLSAMARELLVCVDGQGYDTDAFATSSPVAQHAELLQYTTFDLLRFGPSPDIKPLYGSLKCYPFNVVCSGAWRFLRMLVAGYLHDVFAGPQVEFPYYEPSQWLEADDNKCFVGATITIEEVSIASFRAAMITGKCAVRRPGEELDPLSTSAAWVLYATSERKYRVGRLITVLRFHCKGHAFDLAVVEHFRMMRAPPAGMAQPRYPGGRPYSVRPAPSSADRYHLVDVAAFRNFVHVVPRMRLESEVPVRQHSEWLINAFEGACTGALLTHLEEKEALELH
ncbi:hypothetical protein H9P43_005158 [Blastocladiella emersonii ATCC 22665]|nr:hypothetical protein H9P43_005158 [Blastocladiella emersonii ATCC 22665]